MLLPDEFFAAEGNLVSDPRSQVRLQGNLFLVHSFHPGLLLVEEDGSDLGEALDRWELSLFQDGPFRSEQLRESLVALLGGTDGVWAAVVRGAILLGETARERAEFQTRLADDPDPDAVRRALVETVLRGDRTMLVRMLDETILGLRPAPAARPPSVARALAS